MESNCDDKIADISEQLIKFLRENNEKHWSAIIENIRNEYLVSNNKSVSGEKFVAIMRGGMGSFLDFVLHKDRKPLIDQNNKLDELRHILYEECKKVI